MHSSSSKQQKGESLIIPKTATQQKQQQNKVKLREDWYEGRSSDFHKNVAVQRNVLAEQERDKRGDEMTNETKDAIIEAKFDFAALSGCVSDIRKGFWNIERINDFYKKKIRQTHSHFYQQIIPGRAEERMFAAAKLKRGGFMKLVDEHPSNKDKQAKLKAEPRFESGSERDSRERTLSNEEQNEDVAAANHQRDLDRMDVDLQYKPIVISKQADNLNELLHQTEHASSSNTQDERKKNALIVQMLDQAVADSTDMNLETLPNPAMRKGKSLFVQPTNEPDQQFNFIKSPPRQTGSMFAPASDILNLTKEAKPNEEGRRRLLHAHTKAFTKEDMAYAKNLAKGSGSKRSSRKDSKAKLQAAKPQYYEDMTNEQFVAELMSNSDLELITFTLFDRKLRDKDLCHDLAALLSFHLSEKHKLEYDFEHVKACLPFVDKTLFIEFRDARITMAQLKARIAERRGFAKYKVLEDVYSELTREEIDEIKNRPNAAQLARFLFGKNPTPESYNRPLQPWESNPQCLRSIKYHHKKGASGNDKFNLPTSVKAGSKKQTSVTIKSEEKKKKSINERRGTTVQAYKNSLIDEKQLVSNKARQNKEVELRKHMSSLKTLKRKLAQQIVDKSGKIEEFKQLTLDDLFKHASEMERDRIKAQKNKLTVFKHQDNEEREKLIEKRWNKKVENALQAQVQVYSSAFELNEDITKEQADLYRLKTKMKDPYTYFQERQNRIMKTYELMAAYKTVYKIESEIKEAQAYLKEVDEYYGRTQGRHSPNKQDFDYIRRLVDDGQPVVLDKHMRKALKIKDDMETLEHAMKDDLKESGYNKGQIRKMEENEMCESDEDSQGRRKRKAIKEAKKAAGLTVNSKDLPKRITKKEKARRAFLAERQRQKVLKPKNCETVWQQQQRLANSLKMRSTNNLKQKDHASTTSNFSGMIYESGETFYTSQHQNKEAMSPPYSSMKKQKTKIEVRKLPKYYSSKLITRNQSGAQLKYQSEFDNRIETHPNLSTKEQAAKQESKAALHSNLNNNSTDLLGSTIAALQSAEASPSTKRQGEPASVFNEDVENVGVPSQFDPRYQRRSISSTFQLKSLKKFHQSARSVTTKPIKLQRPGSDMNVVIKIEECEISENNSRPHVKTPIDAKHHENLLSADVRNFVETYGIAVQQRDIMDRPISTVAGGVGIFAQTTTNLHQTLFGRRGMSTSANAQPNSMSMLSGLKATSQNAKLWDIANGHAPGQRLFDRLDSEDEFELSTAEGQNMHLLQQQYQNNQHSDFQYERAGSATMNHKNFDNILSSTSRERGSQRYNASNKVRPTTAKQIGTFRTAGRMHRRQDLDYNGRQQLAEQAMKEQKLLLFQQKLQQNQQRAVFNNSNDIQGSEIIRSIENARQVATDIADQAERNQSSDYNTKAIATRLRSIAQRRIQTATKQAIAASSVCSAGMSRRHVGSTRNCVPLTSTQMGRVAENVSEYVANNNMQVKRIMPSSQYQLTEGSVIQGDKMPTSSAAWLNAYNSANDQTLKVSTETSKQNLIQGVNANRDVYRAQSGFDQQLNRVALVKVGQQQRHDTLSPFDDIPITSGKRANRPKTGARHHYINQGQKNDSQLFGNKQSAQTLLA